MRLRNFICAVLFGVTLFLYWQAQDFDIIYFDDPDFVFAPQVAAGVTPASCWWAVRNVVVGNWHPVTSFSFVLTHELFGLNPGAEHMVNVVFHAANAALLFLVLATMTKALSSPSSSFASAVAKATADKKATEDRPRPSEAGGTAVPPENIWLCAFVAGVFAWHPLRVESVAWISERKDVLFTFFMLLALLCYAQYARAKEENPKPVERRPGRTRVRTPEEYYYLTLIFFIFSYMSKAMAVTLPFLLLLLDFWPLGRFSQGSTESRPTKELLIEKVPFFALMFFFSALTIWMQARHGAVDTLKEVGLAGRFENAIISYASYLGKFFWPTNLALLYPFPERIDPAQVLQSALLLLAITALCILQIRRRPYLAAGWFWYLIAMAPVIGVIKVGEQAMADRYTYLPLIGPVFSLVWLVSGAARKVWFRKVLPIIAVVILAVCGLLTGRQLKYWKNDLDLFGRTAAVTFDNGLAQLPLAQGYEAGDELQKAAVHYRMAIAMKPETYHYLANFDFAGLLARMGYYHAAAAHYEAGLELQPNALAALNNLAWMRATCPDKSVRDGARAVKLGEKACDLSHYQDSRCLATLAAAYAEAGRFEDAMSMAQKAIAQAQQEGNEALMNENQRLLQLYSAHQPYEP